MTAATLPRGRLTWILYPNLWPITEMQHFRRMQATRPINCQEILIKAKSN
jgi:hypothetical protein